MNVKLKLSKTSRVLSIPFTYIFLIVPIILIFNTTFVLPHSHWLQTTGQTLKLQQIASLSGAPQNMELNIIVADEGNPPKKSNMAVTLEIKKALKPVNLSFTKFLYTFSMSNKAKPGMFLLRLEAIALGLEPSKAQVLYQLDHSIPCTNVCCRDFFKNNLFRFDMHIGFDSLYISKFLLKLNARASRHQHTHTHTHQLTSTEQNFRLNSSSGDLTLAQQTSSCSFNVTASIQSPLPTNTSTTVHIYVIKDDVFNVTFLGQGQIKCVSKDVVVAKLLLEKEGVCRFGEVNNGLALKKTPVGFDLVTSVERSITNKRLNVICSDNEGREKVIQFNTTCLPFFSTSHYKVTLNSESNSAGSILTQLGVTNENANFKTRLSINSSFLFYWIKISMKNIFYFYKIIDNINLSSKKPRTFKFMFRCKIYLDSNYHSKTLFFNFLQIFTIFLIKFLFCKAVEP